MYTQCKTRQISVIVTVVLLAGCTPSGTAPQKASEEKATNHIDTSRDNTISSCNNNLKQLGIGCRMYAKAHEGRFPDAIEALFPFIADENVFRCPGAGNGGNSTLGASGSSDYEMIPGMTEKSPARAILIQEKSAGNHTPAGRNVLHIDGSVEFIQ